jgi:hypothetical protein
MASLQEAHADLVAYSERIAAASPSSLDLHAELSNNILPILAGLFEGIGEDVLDELADHEGAIDELMDQSTDVLHPDTAVKIAGTIEFGKAIAIELETLVKKVKVDDLTRKRIKDLISTFREGAAASLDIIQQITIPLDELPDDEDEDDVEGEEPDDAEPAIEADADEPEQAAGAANENDDDDDDEEP